MKLAALLGAIEVDCFSTRPRKLGISGIVKSLQANIERKKYLPIDHISS